MQFVLQYMYVRAMRRERVYRDHLDPLAISDTNLLRYYRFPRAELIELIAELAPFIRRNTLRGHAVPPSIQVLVALRFYASGTFQNVIADTIGLNQSTVSRILNSVTDRLMHKARFEIKMPSSVEEKATIKVGFGVISNFPRVIGTIDGSHIPIKGPSENEEIFINRKSFHSLNIQVVCDHKYQVINYCVRYPGSTHDSFIWMNSDLRRRFDRGEFEDSLLLGDSGYPLERYMMTPIAAPSTRAEEVFNESHSRTRVTVERCFGILKSRFRCLHRSGGSLQYTPQKCAKITTACLLLHNYCVKRQLPMPANELLEEAVPLPANPAVALGGGTGREERARIIGHFQ